MCVKFSRGLAEAGAGYACTDVLVDGALGGAEFGRGLGLVGGQQRAQEPVVQLGLAWPSPSGLLSRYGASSGR